MGKLAQKAKERHDLLWERYQANGHKLTIGEVNRLTGARHGNVYQTFKRYGLEGPPLWDTLEARRTRQIEQLRTAAAEKGRDWLTSSEAAEVLGKPKREMNDLYARYQKYGIPEIIFPKPRKRPAPKAKPVPAPLPDLPSRQRAEIGDAYPNGLPYVSRRLLPNGQVVYLLR